MTTVGVIAIVAAALAAIAVVVRIYLLAKQRVALEPIYRQIEADLTMLEAFLKDSNPNSSKVAKVNAHLPGVVAEVRYVLFLRKNKRGVAYQKRVDVIQKRAQALEVEMKDTLTSMRPIREPIREDTAMIND